MIYTAAAAAGQNCYWRCEAVAKTVTKFASEIRNISMKERTPTTVV